MVRFVARRWYIEEGKDLVPSKLQSKLHEFLPRSLLSKTKESPDGWIQATVAAFNDLGFSSGQKSKDEVGRPKRPLLKSSVNLDCFSM